MELVITVLAGLHIFFAMAWLGGGFLFGFFIAPRLTKLPLPASRAFTVSVVPPVVRFFQAVAPLTVIFGLGLLYEMDVQTPGQLNFSTTWGTSIIVGMSVAFVALIVSEAVAVPALRRVVALNQKMPVDGSSVPPELPRAARTAGLSALVTLVLLLVTLGCMVTAGFY